LLQFALGVPRLPVLPCLFPLGIAPLELVKKRPISHFESLLLLNVYRRLAFEFGLFPNFRQLAQLVLLNLLLSLLNHLLDRFEVCV
jgi:hypothetical protein